MCDFLLSGNDWRVCLYTYYNLSCKFIETGIATTNLDIGGCYVISRAQDFYKVPEPHLSIRRGGMFTTMAMDLELENSPSANKYRYPMYVFEPASQLWRSRMVCRPFSTIEQLPVAIDGRHGDNIRERGMLNKIHNLGIGTSIKPLMGGLFYSLRKQFSLPL